MEIEKVQSEMINNRNKSKHEYHKLVHQLESHMKENVNTQNLFAQKMLQAQNKLTSFMNKSKFESDELINATKTDIRGDITNIKGIIDSLRDFNDQTRKELNGLLQELKRDVQENVTMLQKYIVNEVRNSRSNINYEIKNHISEYGENSFLLNPILFSKNVEINIDESNISFFVCRFYDLDCVCNTSDISILLLFEKI